MSSMFLKPWPETVHGKAKPWPMTVQTVAAPRAFWSRQGCAAAGLHEHHANRHKERRREPEFVAGAVTLPPAEAAPCALRSFQECAAVCAQGTWSLRSVCRVGCAAVCAQGRGRQGACAA